MASDRKEKTTTATKHTTHTNPPKNKKTNKKTNKHTHHQTNKKQKQNKKLADFIIIKEKEMGQIEFHHPLARKKCTVS